MMCGCQLLRVQGERDGSWYHPQDVHGLDRGFELVGISTMSEPEQFRGARGRDGGAGGAGGGSSSSLE